MIGKIVKHKKENWTFFGKVVGSWQDGWSVTGLRDSGVNPNLVYKTGDLCEITEEEVFEMDDHSLYFLCKVRDMKP